MTFRKEDILPYEPVKPERTAAYLKTIFMQYATLEPHVVQNGGLVVDTDPAKFAKLFKLNATDDSNGLPYAPADFPSIFDQALNDPERAEQRRVARQKELKSLLQPMLRPEGVVLKAEVERLIDKELEDSKIAKDLLMRANLPSKASLLADFRIKQRISPVNAKPVNFNPRYKYRAHLTRLVGGHGLNMAVTRLYFLYDVPFHRFETVLQDATQLCYIQPEASPSSGTSTSTTSILEDSHVPAFNTPPSSIPSASTPASVAPISSSPEVFISIATTRSEFTTSWVKTEQPPTRSYKGYTVRDGPWRCRISSTQPSPARQEPVVEVSDKISYDLIVSKLKDYNIKYPQNEHIMMIQHSTERAMYDEEVAKKKSDGRELEEWKNLPPNNDTEKDAYEETYYEWLCRTNRI